MEFEKSLAKSKQIKISNELSRATIKLGAMSFDILCIILSQVKNKDQDFKAYELYVSTLEKQINLELNRDKPRDINDIKKELNRKSLKAAAIELKNAKAKLSNIDLFLFEIFEYDSPKGILKIKLNNQLRSHLLKLNTEYTVAEVKDILSLNGYYPKRIYLLLSGFKNKEKGYNAILKSLHNILDTPQSLQKVYNNFKNRVLVKSINEEINLSTNLTISYKEYKLGRSINRIVFNIVIKEKKDTESRNDNSRPNVLEDWLKSQNEDIIETEIIQKD
jgi:plasmid replication initiation protein